MPASTGGGSPGEPGASAYEIAVENGFVGDEAAWLASLVGAQGDPGEQGEQGPQGEQGETGAAGDVSACWPVGSVFLSVVATSPATLLGFGTWSQIAGGRFLVGQTDGDADFNSPEETGGAKTKAISAHSGAAVADHAAHTHSYSEVPNHTHPIASGQGSHTHTQTTSATDGASGRADASSGGTQYSNVANINAATLPAMVTDNPTGGVASGTTGNPSATLSHNVTQPSAHSDLNVVPPYFTIFVWKRTA